jgi:hypothetical protein
MEKLETTSLLVHSQAKAVALSHVFPKRLLSQLLCLKLALGLAYNSLEVVLCSE